MLGAFYGIELLKVDKSSLSQTLYPVRRILRRRTNRQTGREEFMVEYANANSSIEWIDKIQHDNGHIVWQ